MEQLPAVPDRRIRLVAARNNTLIKPEDLELTLDKNSFRRDPLPAVHFVQNSNGQPHRFGIENLEHSGLSDDDVRAILTSKEVTDPKSLAAALNRART